MESVFCDVANLDEGQRRSLEALVGHPLQGNQRVYIAVWPEAAAPSAEQRRHAFERLREISAEVDAHLRQQGVSPEAWGTAVDAACQEVRSGKQP